MWSFPPIILSFQDPYSSKSNVNIVLETNSVWKANPDESIYHLSAFGKNEGEG